KIKEQVTDLDKKTCNMVGILNKIHLTLPESIPGLLDSVCPILHSCHITCAAITALIPPSQFWRWKEMWTNSLRTAIFSAALVEFLATGKLISLPEVCQILGIKDEWKGQFALPIKDYLHGLISLVNELSRLAVNAVTLGNFKAPIQISIFVKDLFAGVSFKCITGISLNELDGLRY
ncbi:Translin, partial [Suillus brevipes Sb2]